jgi:predicted ATPase
MIFEDVHWIDPTSLEALGRTVDRLRTLPVLLIVSYRPIALYDAAEHRPLATRFGVDARVEFR